MRKEGSIVNRHQGRRVGRQNLPIPERRQNDNDRPFARSGHMVQSEQVAQWDFQNNATRTSPPGPVFVLGVPLRNLLTSMCDFVPCDRIVQQGLLRQNPGF